MVVLFSSMVDRLRGYTRRYHSPKTEPLASPTNVISYNKCVTNYCARQTVVNALGFEISKGSVWAQFGL